MSMNPMTAFFVADLGVVTYHPENNYLTQSSHLSFVTAPPDNDQLDMFVYSFSSGSY